MLSIPQVAERLSLHRTRVWRLVKQGRIKATLVEGGRLNEYRISEESLQEFIESHDSTPGRRAEVKQVESEREGEVQKAPSSEPREEPSDPEV